MVAGVPKETVAVAQLQRHLQARGAEFKPERSSAAAHIYWAPPMRKWLKVYRVAPDVVAIEYHQECPCSG